jgi:outer membrane protein OmpA-like peptidoglycan-associated protein
MTFKFAATSLVALALFIIPARAQENQEQPQAEQPAEAAPAALPEEVLALVNDRRSSQELNDEELKTRARQVRQLAKTPGLPEDIQGQLQALTDADRAELETRAQAQKPAEQPVQEAQPEVKTEEPVQEAQPEIKKEEPVQEAQPETPPAVEPAAIPAEVTDFLNDARPLEELTDEQMAERFKFARQQSRNEKLPEDIRGKLAAMAKEARATLALREKAAEEKKQQEAAPAPAPKVEEPAVQEQAQQPQPESQPVVEAPKVETPPPPAPVVDKVEVKELDGNAGDPEAEKKAAAFLNDATPADSLNDEALRLRLDGMRDLMAENELSQKTERELRKKLRTEREVLRERVTKAKAEEEAKAAALQAEEEKKKQQAAAEAGVEPPAKKDKKPNINIIITADTPTREILRDRREAEFLDESELRYRIRARRDFEASETFRDYDEVQRNEWRQRTRRDREFLGRRLEEDRNIRRVELKKPSNIRRIVIEDHAEFDNDDIPEDVFAAEVEDADIERALLAPPRKKIVRKITVDEIATQPKVRASMTRIEVDTIRFGFNEAFVREEEVDSLDQIASVIERVLQKYPREVFLIEGHTDAVGSDAYNTKLSKARAEAVKKALSTYYIIPSKNLKTVGLGERYLKIPTAEQEQENRRVSISRATAVVGEAE